MTITATRPQRPCLQPHGTVARYSAGCSCLHCCNGWADYQKVRKAEMKEGLTRIVDAAPARAHIRKLIYNGWRMRAIAEQSLVSFTTIHDVLDGRRLRIRRDISDAILTITTTPLGTHSTALVPARPTHRLLERLYREHGRCAVAGAMGISRGSLPRPGQRSMQAWAVKRVREAAETLKAPACSPAAGDGDMVGRESAPATVCAAPGHGHTYRGGEARG
jgi:hypothetical protein